MLTELQFAHCSGALPLAWLAGLTRLRRLYLKGNGANMPQMIGLVGAPSLLPALAGGLVDLYLGLCAFVADDGVMRAVRETVGPRCAPLPLRLVADDIRTNCCLTAAAARSAGRVDASWAGRHHTS